MSIRNAHTGRHEDDLAAGHFQGHVRVGDLLDHCDEIIVANPEVYGSNVCDPVATLTYLVRKIAELHPRVLDLDLDEVALLNRNARAIFNTPDL